MNSNIIEQTLTFILTNPKETVLKSSSINLERLAGIIQDYTNPKNNFKDEMYEYIINQLTDPINENNRKLKQIANNLTKDYLIDKEIEQKSIAKKCAIVSFLSSKTNEKDLDILNNVLKEMYKNGNISVVPDTSTEKLICRAIKELEKLHKLKDNGGFKKCLEKINKYNINLENYQSIYDTIIYIDTLLQNYEKIIKEAEFIFENTEYDIKVCGKNFNEECENKMALLNGLYGKINQLTEKCNNEFDKLIKEGKLKEIENKGDDASWFDKAKVYGNYIFGGF